MVIGGALMAAPPAVAQESRATQTLEVQNRRDRADRWRYRQHNGRWWYWTPSRSWVYWDGGRWIPYGSDYAWGGSRYAPRYYAPRRRDYYYAPGARYGYRYGYGTPYYGSPYYRYGYRGYEPGLYIGRGGIGIRF
jgi:hypothetical protein